MIPWPCSTQSMRRWKAVRSLVHRVTIEAKRIRVELASSPLIAALQIDQPTNSPETIILSEPMHLTRTGRAMKQVHHNGRAMTAATPDAQLIAMLRTGRRWWMRLQEGQTDIASIAREESINDSRVSRMVRLNFLAPPIIEAILSGTLPASMTAASLRARDLPMDWNAQIAMFGI